MSITTANAVVMLGIIPLFPIPQQIQGFASDEVYDVPSIKSAEALMGVDGKKSSGFVYVLIPQTITLQADSLSNAFFDTWWTQNQSAVDDYVASGLIRLPAIGMKFNFVNGSLTGYKPMPAGKKILQPRTYEITWESIAPAPA